MSKQDADLPRSLGKCWGMLCEGASVRSAGLGWCDLCKCLNNTIAGEEKEAAPTFCCRGVQFGARVPKLCPRRDKSPVSPFLAMLVFFPLGHHNEKKVLMGGGKGRRTMTVRELSNLRLDLKGREKRR